MSEQIPSIDFKPPQPRIRTASAVILVRGGQGPERELFWVRRGGKVSFSGGFYAFPGGKVDKADAEIPIEGCRPGTEAFYVAAVRETFEESGVLLARGAGHLSLEKLDELRRELLDGGSFAGILQREGLLLDGKALIPAGRWMTPDFSPIRYDTRFFLAQLPEGQVASVIPGELSDGGWIRPHDALARWEEGSALLHPPNHYAHATLAGFGPEAALPLLRKPPFLDADFVVNRIEFQRGIHFYPLRTPTLPPARHTNCYVVGTGELAVVDPGSPYPEEQKRLLTALSALQDEGRKVKCILLTHHHADHVGGALDLSKRLDVPVYGSAATAERVHGVDGSLADGKVITLGGPMPMRLRCVLTEGHAKGHLCFVDERSGAALVGDMLAQGSTIVIDPPEGDMGVYLESLEKLRALPVKTIYPAHGFPIPDGLSLIDEYVRHREGRMAAILEALKGSEVALSLAAVVERVYAETPSSLFPVAERSALASLLELQRRGQVLQQESAWRIAGPDEDLAP